MDTAIDYKKELGNQITQVILMTLNKYELIDLLPGDLKQKNLFIQSRFKSIMQGEDSQYKDTIRRLFSYYIERYESGLLETSDIHMDSSEFLPDDNDKMNNLIINAFNRKCDEEEIDGDRSKYLSNMTINRYNYFKLNSDN